MDSRHQVRLAMAGWIVVVIALLTVVQYLQPPAQSLAWVAIFDAGHAPLFGVIALAILRVLRASPLAERHKRHILFCLAFAFSVTLGVLSEWWQVAAHRNRDSWDVLHNAFGAGAFLLLAAASDPEIIARSTTPNRLRKLCGGAALILLALAFTPAVLVGYAYAQRAAAFPVLCDFNGSWEARFMSANHAELEFVPAPSANAAPIASEKEGAPAWRIHFEPARFSAFKLLEPYPDWTGYQHLRLVLQSRLADPVGLVLRIHDRQHDERPADRFVRELAIIPGTNEFNIPLTEIRLAPRDREMNMMEIARLNLYVVGLKDQLELDLLELHLQ